MIMPEKALTAARVSSVPSHGTTTFGLETVGLAERAKELAASGEFQYVYEIERRLKSEGRGSAEKAFRSNPHIKSELRALIAAYWIAPGLKGLPSV